jgi:hypothetical protein
MEKGKTESTKADPPFPCSFFPLLPYYALSDVAGTRRVPCVRGRHRAVCSDPIYRVEPPSDRMNAVTTSADGTGPMPATLPLRSQNVYHQCMENGQGVQVPHRGLVLGDWKSGAGDGRLVLRHFSLAARTLTRWQGDKVTGWQGEGVTG